MSLQNFSVDIFSSETFWQDLVEIYLRFFLLKVFLEILFGRDSVCPFQSFPFPKFPFYKGQGINDMIEMSDKEKLNI